MELAEKLNDHDIVLNLAGSSLFGIWTNAKRKKILESRRLVTSSIVESFKYCSSKPKMFINASAIGIYGQDGEKDENNKNYDDDFLAYVVKEWEKAAISAENYNVPTAIIRFGVVLGRGGGSYEILRTLTKFNLGAYFGKGEQKLSFIYIQDVVRSIRFIIQNDITGIINLTAPAATTYKEFIVALKSKLNAILIWRIPEILIKIILGKASVVVLKSQNVKPFVLSKNRFNFEAPDIHSCIKIIEKN